MQTKNRKPILYTGLVDIRFADLDYYGHVNSKHYVDLVSTTRLNFLANSLKTPISQITDRGIGFFLSKSIINYKRPIVGLQKVNITSHVESIRAPGALIIPFSITSTTDKLFSDGVLEFALIDLKIMKTTHPPDWVIDLFFSDMNDDGETK